MIASYPPSFSLNGGHLNQQIKLDISTQKQSQVQTCDHNIIIIIYYYYYY